MGMQQTTTKFPAKMGLHGRKEGIKRCPLMQCNKHLQSQTNPILHPVAWGACVFVFFTSFVVFEKVRKNKERTMISYMNQDVSQKMKGTNRQMQSQQDKKNRRLFKKYAQVKWSGPFLGSFCSSFPKKDNKNNGPHLLGMTWWIEEMNSVHENIPGQDHRRTWRCR